MLDKLKQLFKSRDNKPLTISIILNRDSCSRLLSHYAEHEMSDCESLVIISKSSNGVTVRTTENLDAIEALGLLQIASSLLIGDSDG